MKKVIIGSLFAAILCSTPQQTYAMFADIPAKDDAHFLAKATLCTGILATLVAYGAARAIEKTVAFTWRHKYELALIIIGAYASHIATSLAMTNNLSYQAALALVNSHKEQIAAMIVAKYNAVATNTPWLKTTFEAVQKHAVTPTWASAQVAATWLQNKALNPTFKAATTAGAWIGRNAPIALNTVKEMATTACQKAHICKVATA